MTDGVMHIAEIPYDTGELRYRYERYLSQDAARWIRHGLFCAYWKNGQLKSEGLYEHGFETGVWSDYHENRQLAARGEYVRGKQQGVWQFWGPDGNEEQSVQYDDGEEIA